MFVLKKKWRALKKIVWRHACIKKKWRAVQSGILSILAPHTMASSTFPHDSRGRTRNVVCTNTRSFPSAQMSKIWTLPQFIDCVGDHYCACVALRDAITTTETSLASQTLYLTVGGRKGSGFRAYNVSCPSPGIFSFFLFSIIHQTLPTTKLTLYILTFLNRRQLYHHRTQTSAAGRISKPLEALPHLFYFKAIFPEGLALKYKHLPLIFH